MQTWIFQANPTKYNIDEFLSSGQNILLYRTPQNRDKMSVGDQVFIWRGVGGKNTEESPAGIIAEFSIASEPKEMADSAGKAYWLSDYETNTIENRVELKLIRTAKSRGLIKRSWLKTDPILQELTILKMAQSTNYLTKPDHASRLNDLWDRTGEDWNRGEIIASLWAYVKTYGGTVSQKSGSEVANTAILIGRTVGGVYNSVMNFKHLDPRIEQAGLSGAGTLRATIWNEYFDIEEQTLDKNAIEEEYLRLWPQDGSKGTITKTQSFADYTTSNEEKTLEGLSLEELKARLRARSSSGPKSRRPKSKKQAVRVFVRDSLLVAIVKVHAKFNCELPECQNALFRKPNNKNYCEVHHIHPLADGGEDALENMICLCPSHHLEAHFGQKALELEQEFGVVRASNPIFLTKD